jgi:hypothetical protein
MHDRFLTVSPTLSQAFVGSVLNQTVQGKLSVYLEQNQKQKGRGIMLW